MKRIFSRLHDSYTIIYLSLLFLSIFTLSACTTARTSNTNWIKSNFKIISPNDSRYRDLLARIFFRLSPTTSWNCLILLSSRTNAYSGGDKEIFITSGLISKLEEEELAAVLAHEMAHHLLNHPQLSAADGSINSYNINYEMEADTLALKLLSAGGYDPTALYFALKSTSANQDPSITKKRRDNILANL